MSGKYIATDSTQKHCQRTSELVMAPISIHRYPPEAGFQITVFICFHTHHKFIVTPNSTGVLFLRIGFLLSVFVQVLCAFWEAPCPDGVGMTPIRIMRKLREWREWLILHLRPIVDTKKVLSAHDARRAHITLCTFSGSMCMCAVGLRRFFQVIKDKL